MKFTSLCWKKKKKDKKNRIKYLSLSFHIGHMAKADCKMLKY